MGRLGLEPRTIRLKAEYSTIELATRSFGCFLHTVDYISTNFPCSKRNFKKKELDMGYQAQGTRVEGNKSANFKLLLAIFKQFLATINQSLLPQQLTIQS